MTKILTFNIEINFRTNHLRISNSYTHSKHKTECEDIFDFKYFTLVVKHIRIGRIQIESEEICYLI